MTKPIKINLALQGGGAHGAFTWGVLDRLLQEPGIEISGISGTSAGALNGAALKAGWLQGGNAGARENLDWLWQQMGAVTDPLMTGWITGMAPSAATISAFTEFSLPVLMADALSQVTTPYAMGMAYSNPLRRVVRKLRFDQVCSKTGPCLFVGATNVRTGKIRVFSGDGITTDSLLASACLPTMFQAIEIDDPVTGTRDSYWDGGYSGNPALFPLFEPELPDDIVIVNINPLERAETPRTPQQIQNRINEISFNSSLLRELRAIGFVKRLLAEGKVPPGTMKDIKVHMIADDALMNDLSVGTKMMPSPALLHRLKEAGQAAAEKFMDNHKADLGQRSSVDLDAAVN